MCEPKPLLQVEGLKVHFPIKKGFFSKTTGHVYAVVGVSLTLKERETLGLVGESGCGKTTTGMAILKLVQPTAGKVFFKGKNLLTLPREELQSVRREIQMVFQDPYSSLNPRMTVNQILSDPMRIHHVYRGKAREERIAYLLEKVGLSPDQGKRFPHEFSGGQRQRIGIARALSLNPRIVIGDEPVSALDVSIQAQIINLLKDLQQEFRLSYIIISHDLAVVEHVCDWVAVMYLGKVIEMGSCQDIYTDPRHPYTQALLSAVPIPNPRMKRKGRILKGDVPSPIHPPSGCRFHPRCESKMDGCVHEEPALTDLGGEHYVACHLATEAA